MTGSRARLPLVAAVLVGCGHVKNWTRVGQHEDVRIVEIAPTSLPEDPRAVPEANRVTLIDNDGRLLEVVPGSIYRAPGFVVMRRAPHLEETRHAIDQLHAIHFESVTMQELWRTKRGCTELSPTTIVIAVLLSVASIAGLIAAVVIGEGVQGMR